jgi:hypothetical protein
MIIAPLTMHERVHWPLALRAAWPRMRWLARTPYALLLHAQEHGTARGCAGALRFGADARIVLLHAEADDAALRAALLDALIALLQEEGVERIHGVVRRDARSLWGARGFAPRERLLRAQGGRFVQASRAEVAPMEPRHRLGVLHLDQRATGMLRHALLLEHEYLAHVYLDGTVVRGFAMPLLGEGLIVADAPHAGLELQRWLLPHQAQLLLPESSPALAHLAERGYAQEAVGTRMTLGLDAARPDLIYAEAYGAA